MRGKGLSENHGNAGTAAVASVRTWRDSPADTPWPLTDTSSVAPKSEMNNRFLHRKKISNANCILFGIVFETEDG